VASPVDAGTQFGGLSVQLRWTQFPVWVLVSPGSNGTYLKESATAAWPIPSLPALSLKLNDHLMLAS